MKNNIVLILLFCVCGVQASEPTPPSFPATFVNISTKYHIDITSDTGKKASIAPRKGKMAHMVEIEGQRFTLTAQRSGKVLMSNGVPVIHTCKVSEPIWDNKRWRNVNNFFAVDAGNNLFGWSITTKNSILTAHYTDLESLERTHEVKVTRSH